MGWGGELRFGLDRVGQGCRHGCAKGGYTQIAAEPVLGHGKENAMNA